MSPSAGLLTLGFGSGRDLRVTRSSPMSGSVLDTVCLSFSLSLCPPLCSVSLSLSNNQINLYTKQTCRKQGSGPGAARLRLARPGRRRPACPPPPAPRLRGSSWRGPALPSERGLIRRTTERLLLSRAQTSTSTQKWLPRWSPSCSSPSTR